jgi:hypothetical protein
MHSFISFPIPEACGCALCIFLVFFIRHECTTSVLPILQVHISADIWDALSTNSGLKAHNSIFSTDVSRACTPSMQESRLGKVMQTMLTHEMRALQAQANGTASIFLYNKLTNSLPTMATSSPAHTKPSLLPMAHTGLCTVMRYQRDRQERTSALTMKIATKMRPIIRRPRSQSHGVGFLTAKKMPARDSA